MRGAEGGGRSPPRRGCERGGVRAARREEMLRVCNFIHAALWEFTRARYLLPPLLCINWSQIGLLLQEAAFISMLCRPAIFPAVSCRISVGLSLSPLLLLPVSHACRLASWKPKEKAHRGSSI